MRALNVITVEVAYALPEEQTILALQVNQNTTVAEAIAQSGILVKHPEIDLAKNQVGLFGRRVSLNATLRDKDRIEIYRPLRADPKEIRRKRAQVAKAIPTK